MYYFCRPLAQSLALWQQQYWLDSTHSEYTHESFRLFRFFLSNTHNRRCFGQIYLCSAGIAIQQLQRVIFSLFSLLLLIIIIMIILGDRNARFVWIIQHIVFYGIVLCAVSYFVKLSGTPDLVFASSFSIFMRIAPTNIWLYQRNMAESKSRIKSMESWAALQSDAVDVPFGCYGIHANWIEI